MKLLSFLILLWGSTLPAIEKFVPTNIIQIDEHWVTLADQWEHGDVTEIGTILVDDVFCFETYVSLGSGGDVKIMGPVKCHGDVAPHIIDEAIRASFQEF